MQHQSREQPGEYHHGRYFYIGEQAGLACGWYMRSREGLHGPFDSRAAAEAMLRALISTRPRKRISNWHGPSRPG